MSESENQYLQPPPRSFELLTGAACCLAASCLLALGAFGLYLFVREAEPPPTPAVVLVSVSILLGLMLAVFSWRLLLRRRRARDGGLISPLGLRLGGLFFLGAPLALFWLESAMPIHLGIMFTGGCACFALAQLREKSLNRRSSPEPVA